MGQLSWVWDFYALDRRSLTQSIGNIGNSLMSGSGSPEGNDVQSIGTLILRIMQPGTMYKNPDETNLQNSHGWSNDMVDFLKAAWTSGLEELLMVRTQNTLICPSLTLISYI